MLNLETLSVKIIAQASEYQATIRKVISDTNAATGNIKNTINAALNAQKQAAREAAKAAAQVERETKRAAATEIRLAQQRDATIAKHYLQSHLRSLDQAASAEKRAAAESIRAAQRRDAQIARNYVQEHRRAQALAARAPTLGARIGGVATPAAGMLRSAAGGVSRAGRAMTTGITAPVMGAGAASIAAYAGFDDAITRAAAVAGNVSDKMRAKLETNAKAIGASGIIGATEVAKGYVHLIQSGLSVEASLEAINTVQRFATASAMDLAKATELLSQSQSVLGLRTEDAVRNAQNMTRVSDVITKASILSTASIEDFAKALVTKSGAAMRILGKDVTEGTAALAAMANQGTKAELAGERLYVMLRDSQQAAIKNAVAWKTLGVSVFDASGKMRHIADIIAGLENLMGGMSDEQRKITMKMLGFSDRSVAATYSMLGLSGAIRDYERQLQGASGATDRIAKTIEGSFLSQLKTLWNQLQVVGIEIGQVLAPHVKTLTGYVQQAAQWFRNLSTPAKETIAIVAAIAAGIGPVVLAFGSMIASAAAMTAGLALLVAVGPEVLAITAAIGAAVAAVGGVFAYVAGESAMAWYAMRDPSGAKAVAETFGKLVTTTQRIFQALLGWITTTAVPAVITGLAKLWYRAMKWQIEFIAKAYMKIPELIGKALSGQRITWADLFGKDFVAGASSSNFFKTAGSIIEEEFGEMGRKASGAFRAGQGKLPTASAAPTGFARPDVVGTAATKSPTEIAGMLDSLSPETKKAEAALAKDTKKIASEAERAKRALISEGKALEQSLRTPLERINLELARAKELLKQGVIGMETFRRLQQKLADEMDRAQQKSAPKGRGTGGGSRGGGDSGNNSESPTGGGFWNYSGGLGFRAPSGDDAQQILIREHVAKSQAHLHGLSARRRAGLGKPKPPAPPMSPAELAADRQARLFGYSGLAGARRSAAGAQAALVAGGRVVKGPVGNPLAGRIPSPHTFAGRAGAAAFAGEEHDRYREIARADEAELRGITPQRVGLEPSSNRAVSRAAEMGLDGSDFRGAGKGQQDTFKLQASLDKLSEEMEKNTEATKDSSKNLQAANL